MHGSSGADRTIGIMGGDHDVVRIGHRRNLFYRCNAAGASRIGLQNASRLFFKDGVEVELSLEAFAGRNGHIGGTLQCCHGIGVLRWNGLFDEEGVEGFQHPYYSPRRSKVPLAMALHADIEARACFPDARNHLAYFVKNGGRELAVVSGIGTKWIVLSRGCALSDQFLRAARVRLAGARNVAPPVAGINSYLVARLPSQQFVERYIQPLADDVPE